MLMTKIMANLSGFEKFCGGELWNATLTWNTNYPDFTPCFQGTVLPWTPCIFLWAVCIVYIPTLASIKSYPLPSNKLNAAKTILSLGLTIVAIVDLVRGLHDRKSDGALSLVVTPTVQITTSLLTAILIQVERRKGFITSGVLFIYWLLLTIVGIVPFYSKIYNAKRVGTVEDPLRVTTFFISYALALIQLVLSCISDVDRAIITSTEKNVCPETRASFISRLVYWWINSLVLTAYKKTLTEKDLWAPNPRDRTDTTYSLLRKAWNEELTYKQGCLKESSSTADQSKFFNDTTPPTETTQLLNNHPRRETAESKPKKNPSLFRALVKVYGVTLLQSHFCKLVSDVVTFVGPMLQSQLIGYTEDPSVEQWKGYLFASLFFFTTVLNSCCFQMHFHIAMTMGMRVKAALIAAVYKKALKMSNEARKTSTVGEIVNLMSVDAQRMQDSIGFLYVIWSAPVQVVIALYMLWNILGPSVLTGLAVMILLIPINLALATVGKKFQTAQMSQKDERMKLMNEVLSGMKVLKLYAWELSFKDKVNEIRERELDTLKKYSYLNAVGTFISTCAPFLVTLATFATYVLTGNNLDSAKAFTALSLFNILRYPINMLPTIVTYIVTASVSLKRLSSFLLQPDLVDDNVEHNSRSAYPITIDNGTFAWGTGPEDAPVLKSINMAVQDNKLFAVVGPVGCGKSSLISAILGEMDKLSGLVNVRGSIAYNAQQAWIQNATLKDNILFGKPYIEEKYKKIIEACALGPDLEILPGGDTTEIGEKGINLSGGQKQRVSLARAVYQDCDIYLLDDPLSAVDSHVGKHIFDHVVGNNGLLGKKTRLLVTHGVHWLPKVDQVVALSNGEITDCGSYEELMSRDGPFAQFLKTYLLQQESDDESEDDEIQQTKRKMLQRMDSFAPTESSAQAKASDGSESNKSLRRRKSTSSIKRSIHRGQSVKDTILEKKTKDDEKLIQEEKSEVGKVQFKVYLAYFTALGIHLAISLLLAFMLYQAASVGSNVWLSQWTEDPILKNTSLSNTTEYTSQRNLYLGVYGGIGVLQAFFVLVYAILAAISQVRASRQLHEGMLFNILRSPMSFFDTTPLGRILNRFSRDVETIDNVLPQLLRSWMNMFFSVVSTIVIISYSTPIFLAVVVPLAVLYVIIQRFYIPTTRQLKRIESTTRSPIYAHFSETITGASTIRAFGESQRFIEISAQKVDHNLSFYFASIASSRWLGFRLELLGALTILAAAMFAVIGRGSVSGGLVGLSISYALQITSALNWMVRMSTDLETNVVSVERIKEYSQTEQEAPWQVPETKPPSRWPDEGKVALEDYSTRYRAGLDLVLKGITVNIGAGEKVGIVGRTGAGKSSLTLALFRIIEAAGGSVIIDGLNIATLGLHQLRSKLTILPQDPVLFSGTLRMNLDPFSKYSDDQIWSALSHAHLEQFVRSIPSQLEYECGEGGQNLSVGQRQLVCLARTLLRKTRILILDEATAAVDLETDELIQKTIRQEFARYTVLTIAHRLNTILDNDRVVVLDMGKIKEFDSPTNLLEKKDSIFYGMAKDAGLVS